MFGKITKKMGYETNKKCNAWLQLMFLYLYNKIVKNCSNNGKIIFQRLGIIINLTQKK